MGFQAACVDIKYTLFDRQAAYYGFYNPKAKKKKKRSQGMKNNVNKNRMK